MRPGDMDQWEVETERTYRVVAQILVALILMCAASTIVGIAIGYMLWGL